MKPKYQLKNNLKLPSSYLNQWKILKNVIKEKWCSEELTQLPMTQAWQENKWNHEDVFQEASCNIKSAVKAAPELNPHFLLPASARQE